MQPLPSWSLEMQKNLRLFIFWETTQHFLNLKTETSVIFSLNYKVQSWIYGVREMLIN